MNLTTNKKVFLSIIIPAYNEEGRILSTLKSIVDFFRPRKDKIEIIVVDDGSSDQTIRVVESFFAGLKEDFLIWKIIKNEKNFGKGFSVKKGVLAASGEYIFYTDADGAVSINQIEKLFRHIYRYPVVIGSKYLIDKKKIRHEKIFRRLAAKINNLIVRNFLGLNFADTQCPFKLFRRDAAQKIFSQLNVKGWGFDVEILAWAKKFDIAVYETAVEWQTSSHSKLHIFKDSFNTFREIIEIKKNLAIPTPQVFSTVLIAFLIFFFALFIRFQGLNVAGNTWDEYFYYNASKSYLKNLIKLDFRAESWRANYEHPPVGKYVYFPSIILDKLTKTSYAESYRFGRATAAMISSLTVVLIYFIGKRFWDEKIGVLAAVFLALLPPFVAYGKIQGLDATLVLFFTLAVYQFLLALESQRFKNYLLSAIFTGLAIGTKFNALLLFPLFLVLFLIKKPKWNWFLFWLPFISLGIVFLLWPWLWQNPRYHLEVTLNHWIGRVGMVFFGQHRILPIYYFLAMFFFTTPLIILVLLGFFFYKKLFRSNFYNLASVLWFFAPFLISFYHLRQDSIRYVLTAYPPFALIVSVAVWKLLNSQKNWQQLAVISTLMFYLLAINFSIYPYYLDYYNEAIGGPQYVARKNIFELGFYGEGIKEGLEYINKIAHPGQTVHYEIVPDDAPFRRSDLIRLDKLGADYLIFNTVAKRVKHDKIKLDGYHEIYSVKAMGAPFVWVYEKNK